MCTPPIVILSNVSPGARRTSGVALITAVLLLLLISGTIVSTIDYSGSEHQAAGRSRATSNNLYAADSGIQLGLKRVQIPRDLTAFSYNLSDGTVVESRKRDEGAPQDIEEKGTGQPPEGYSINVGSGYMNELFDVNVTAVSPSGSTTELTSRISSLQPNSGTY